MFCMQFTALYRIVYERISVWTRKNAELAWVGCSAAHHMFKRRDGDAKQSFPEPPASLRHLQRHFVTLSALTSCQLCLPLIHCTRRLYQPRLVLPAAPSPARRVAVTQWLVGLMSIAEWCMLLWHSSWLPAPFAQSTNAPNAYIFYFLCLDVVLINITTPNTHARVHTVPLTCLSRVSY